MQKTKRPQLCQLQFGMGQKIESQKTPMSSWMHLVEVVYESSQMKKICNSGEWEGRFYPSGFYQGGFYPSRYLGRFSLGLPT